MTKNILRQLIDPAIRKYGNAGYLFWRFSAGRRGLISGFILLAIFGALTESFGVFLLVPLLESMGQNNIFSNTPLLGAISHFFDSLPAETRLIWAGIIMLIVVLLRGVLQFVQEFLGYAIPHWIDFALRMQAFTQLLQTNIRFSDELAAGELSNFAVAHPARIGIAMRFFATFFASLFVLASYILVLAVIAPYMCLAAIIYVIFATLIYRWLTSDVVHRVGLETTKATEAFSQLFYETLSGAKMIRLSGATRSVETQLKQTIKTLRQAKDRTVAVENMTVPIFSVMGGLLICGLVIIVGFLDQNMASKAIGLLVIFIVLIFRILSPLSIINISRNNMIIHLDALSEYDEVFQRAQDAKENDGAIQFEQLNDCINIENVSFAYEQNGPKALSKINLRIKKGEMVAIVGRSGSGKSSLISLITRLYRPDNGQILVDGVSLNDLKIESWWSHLAVVPQENMLINDTIRANISFGLRGAISEDAIRKAAQQASIDEWIEGLEQGYDTILADRGTNLSGGERQRLALARAFLRDPDILILDEATSAVDSLTGKTVEKQLLLQKGKKTLIIIAHNLPTIYQADRILVLDDGKIVEQGCHEELLAMDGIYRQMVDQQSLDMVTDISVAN